MATRNAVKRTTERLASALLGVALALFAACSRPPPIQGGAPLPSDAAAGAGALEEIAVTGSRLERNAGTSERFRVEPRQSQSVPMASTGAEPAGRLVAGMRPGGSTLLSQVQPGEELWVIQTASPETAAEDSSPGSGTMLALVAPSRDAAPTEVPLPLRHTDVRAVVTGYVSAVDVTQQFENPYDEKIEAVYLFRCPRRPPSTSS